MKGRRPAFDRSRAPPFFVCKRTASAFWVLRRCDGEKAPLRTAGVKTAVRAFALSRRHGANAAFSHASSLYAARVMRRNAVFFVPPSKKTAVHTYIPCCRGIRRARLFLPPVPVRMRLSSARIYRRSYPRPHPALPRRGECRLCACAFFICRPRCAQKRCFSCIYLQMNLDVIRLLFNDKH